MSTFSHCRLSVRIPPRGPVDPGPKRHTARQDQKQVKRKATMIAGTWTEAVKSVAIFPSSNPFLRKQRSFSKAFPAVKSFVGPKETPG